MKKLLFVFVIACGSSHYAVAQTKSQTQNSVGNTSASSAALTHDQKMSSVKNCPELLNQLTEKFGKDFSLNDPKVIALLKNNTTDNTVSPVIRKLSVYLINNTKSN